jgi:hypothetical protein
MSNDDENKKMDINKEERDFLKNKILDLEKKMDRILELLETDCKKMSDHIDFVENVYDSVKNPFNYVMDKVKNFSSSEKKHILNGDKNEDRQE